MAPPHNMVQYAMYSMVGASSFGAWFETPCFWFALLLLPCQDALDVTPRTGSHVSLSREALPFTCIAATTKLLDVYLGTPDLCFRNIDSMSN
jgi:hypothetical protein